MKQKKKVSLLFQIAMLFIIGVILIGALSIVALYGFSTKYVMERLETDDLTMMSFAYYGSPE